jgi:hypothetical protein
VWEEAGEMLNKEPYNSDVIMARVDCTAPSATDVCRSQHVHAFPTIRIYRDRSTHSQENYMSDRTQQALLRFIERNLPAQHSATGKRALPFWEQPEIQLNAPQGADGCIIHGSLLVNRVPGNFHISAHSTSHSLHMPTINLSHSIQHLSFGRSLNLAEFYALPKEVAAAYNPMHGSGFVAHSENVTIEHYLKVVHTTFERAASADGHISTYQHTVNSHQYQDHEAYPAIVFSYDLAPIEVIVQREQESLAAFLTQICAIVGGVFTVTGLVRACAAIRDAAGPHKLSPAHARPAALRLACFARARTHPAPRRRRHARRSTRSSITGIGSCDARWK